MRIEINPRIGINSLTFGVERKVAREVLSSTFGPYIAGLRGSDAYDFYSIAGLFAYYDATDKLEALEVARPSEAIFSGADILSMNLGEAISFLSAQGEDVHSETDGVTSFSCGVALYAPMAKENKNAEMESVLVFRDGYYH